jgi:Predicted phosphohydrolases
LPQQSWTVLGNHDRDVDTVSWRQTRSYNEAFGADMYAFNEGRCHFIVLNNVFPEGARGYKGRFSERQLRFVRQDMQLVPSDRLVILCMHVPLAHSRNADELISLVEGRGDVLVLSGHMHQVARFFHEGRDVRLHELGAGATCGFWWVGEKDADGVPAALQQEGTPRNYFVLDFDDTRYQLRCKAVGQDASRQMTIHVTGIDSLDTHLRDMKDHPAGLVMMTVWGGCDSTEVRCRVDDGPWQVCSKQALIDPNVARARELNLQRIYPTKYNRMNPLRHRESHQLWTFQLPADACRGAHTIEVEASDRFGFRATGRRSFCFPQKN